VTEPRRFWAHFEALTRIPRASLAEGPAIEHVRSWAAGHGYEVAQDSGRNVVIRVPATPGRKAAPTVILQGHLDMVCERDPGSPNDPAEGRIELVRDGDWLAANGTTLGADNGVAIAAMMAIAEDESLAHGPLELLMTVAEEIGLVGVNKLDGSLLSGTVLLNLDGSDDETLVVGCAGSADSWLDISRGRQPWGEKDVALAVTVTGGLGGHSGADIARGRSNAIKVLGRVLREASEAVRFRLVSLEGGKSRNAIPRDATAVVAVSDAEGFTTAVERAATSVRSVFAKTDPALEITVATATLQADAWSENDTGTLLDLLAIVPSGPLAMSPAFEGLVETSTSLGEALTEGDRLTLHSLTRSSNDPALPDVIATLDAAAELGGGRLRVQQNHGGWLPDLDSPLLALTRQVYRELFDRDPEVTAVHGGLEPAVIGGKVAGLDMISLGPRIEGLHAPGERLSISSVERFWQLTAALLDAMSRAPWP
jgi:dipeptidase D